MWSEVIESSTKTEVVDNVLQRLAFVPGRHHKMLVRGREVWTCFKVCEIDGVIPYGTLMTSADCISATLSNDLLAQSNSIIVSDCRICDYEQQGEFLSNEGA